MVDAKPKEDSKVENPPTHFHKPQDVVQDKTLSMEEKKKALSTWEQDARQVLTASNEGMHGSEEGAQPDHRHRLGDVVRAKDTMGENGILCSHRRAHSVLKTLTSSSLPSKGIAASGFARGACTA
jgi:hypothetical protein